MREVASDRLNVSRGWLHQIDNGDIGNGVSLRVNVSMSSALLVVRAEARH